AIVRKTLVAGGGGFVGGHLVKRLKAEGLWVRVADLKYNEYSESPADEFLIGDLTDPAFARRAIDEVEDLYQLDAEMGGAGYIFTSEHDADIMYRSAMINLNLLESGRLSGVSRFFFSSSACVYPEYNQLDPENPKCAEDSVYPAKPDSEYGWEKLFSERLYLAYMRNHHIAVRIARFHNIFGPECSWRDNREKAPAAICRKVAEAENGGSIEIWGDGKQTRSFLYIGECVEGIRRLMESDFSGPLNIGSEEMVSLDELAGMIIGISGKTLSIQHVPGPTGVRGRNSDNRLIRKTLGWSPSLKLIDGLRETYAWIAEQVRAEQEVASARNRR